MIPYVQKVFLSIMLTMFFFLSFSSTVDLASFYRKGEIRLDPDPHYGAATNWDDLAFHPVDDMTVAPDGAVFIAGSRAHSVFKFDRNGRFLKKFGQKGQGPGDFTSPGDLSILDGKYLVVGEYALNHRISLFDLEGKFVKLLKTKNSVFRVVSLREGKIAYKAVSSQAVKDDNTEWTQIVSVHIMDTTTGSEIEAARFTYSQTNLRIKSGSMFTLPDVAGDAIIAGTDEGNLLVGSTLEPVLDVYSPNGKKICSIKLNMTPQAPTRKYIEQYKDSVIKGMESSERARTNTNYRAYLQKLKNLSFAPMFKKWIPIFNEIAVDSEGNILVFRRTDCFGDCPVVFQAYTSEGAFIGEAKLTADQFDLKIDPRAKNLCFTSSGIFAMLPLKGTDEACIRLIKADLK